jgi:L-ascorbate metabolism protein UlaG (beta-lactamase superfamily)
MSVFSTVASLSILSCLLSAPPASEFEQDTLPTSAGDLKITFIGHGTLMFEWAGKVVHVDPIGRYANYAKLPKADVILITHEHGDHLDKQAIEQVTGRGTTLALTAASKGELGYGVVMKNGDVKEFDGLRVEAVPAYNIVHTRGPGQPYHAKGDGNGYVIAFGDRRVYVAGDTESIPEMAELSGIDVAFLPMNLPYTMTPEMVVKAVRMLKPKIVYPYHFGNTDTAELVRMLEEEDGVEVRIRKMK